MRTPLITALIVAMSLSGCMSIATRKLTDEQIVSQSALALGATASHVSLVSKRSEGFYTYANVKTGGKEYTCVLNGGSLFSLGMASPAACTRKGAGASAAPLGY